MPFFPLELLLQARLGMGDSSWGIGGIPNGIIHCNLRICGSFGAGWEEAPQGDPGDKKYSFKCLQNSKLSHKNRISQQFLLGANPATFPPRLIHPKKPQNPLFPPKPNIPRMGGRYQAGILEHYLRFFLSFIPGRKSSPRESLSGFFSIIFLCHIPKKNLCSQHFLLSGK